MVPPYVLSWLVVFGRIPIPSYSLLIIHLFGPLSAPRFPEFKVNDVLKLLKSSKNNCTVVWEETPFIKKEKMVNNMIIRGFNIFKINEFIDSYKESRTIALEF